MGFATGTIYKGSRSDDTGVLFENWQIKQDGRQPMIVVVVVETSSQLRETGLRVGHHVLSIDNILCTSAEVATAALSNAIGIVSVLATTTVADHKLEAPCLLPHAFAAYKPESGGKCGITIGCRQGSLVISRISGDSIFAGSGLRPGSQLVMINNEKPSTPQEAAAQLSMLAGFVTIVVYENGSDDDGDNNGICKLLGDLQLAHLEHDFLRNGICSEADVALLSRLDLQELGVTIGDRNRLLAWVETQQVETTGSSQLKPESVARMSTLEGTPSQVAVALPQVSSQGASLPQAFAVRTLPQRSNSFINATGSTLPQPSPARTQRFAQRQANQAIGVASIEIALQQKQAHQPKYQQLAHQVAAVLRERLVHTFPTPVEMSAVRLCVKLLVVSKGSRSGRVWAAELGGGYAKLRLVYWIEDARTGASLWNQLACFDKTSSGGLGFNDLVKSGIGMQELMRMVDKASQEIAWRLAAVAGGASVPNMSAGNQTATSRNLGTQMMQSAATGFAEELGAEFGGQMADVLFG